MDDQRKPDWRGRAGIVANNLIPVLGVLLLGWEAGPVLVLLWLDGWLGIWELGAAACGEVLREDPEVIPARITGFKRRLYWGFTYLLFCLILSIPSLLAWVGLTAVTDQQYPDGLLFVAFAAPGTALALGLNILLRAVQTVRAARRPEIFTMAFTLEEKFHLLAFKAIAMFFLASYLEHAGRTGLAAYVILISAFFAWAEWKPEVILHLLKVPRRPRTTGSREEQPPEDGAPRSPKRRRKKS